jgi:hypothetical protein
MRLSDDKPILLGHRLATLQLSALTGTCYRCQEELVIGPQVGASGEVAATSQSYLSPWFAPKLVCLETVAERTSKVDLTGRNDGGTFLKKRT